MTEIFKRYSTTVYSLSEAWVFVMSKIDQFENQNVEIRSKTIYDVIPDVQYEVTVYGTVNE